MPDTDAESSKKPMELAEEELGCDEHEIVFFEEGGNYGRCCRRCGEKIGNGWIPHRELTEAQRENAIENRKAINKKFRRQVWERMKEIEREIQWEQAPTLTELSPGKSANPLEWRDAFDTLDDEPKEIREEIWPELYYEKYLQSKVWQETRERVFEEKGEECSANLSVCDGTATVVHHRSYEHLGTEPMWDLMPVCSSCHDVLHRLEEDENFSGDEDSGDSDANSLPPDTYEELFGEPALDE